MDDVKRPIQKKSKRRNSILKTASTGSALDRDPLQDIRNSPNDLVAPVSFKAKRRSSFGRRVSFSSATKVKEFRTDDRALTIWDSTYEEEKNSSCSQVAASSQFERTTVGNDDMEITTVTQPILLQKFGSVHLNNSTFVISREDDEDDEMELTGALQKNTTAISPNKRLDSNADMEETCAIPVSLLRKASRNETITNRKIDVEMEETCAVPFRNNHLVERESSCTKQIDANMEGTCVLPNIIANAPTTDHMNGTKDKTCTSSKVKNSITRVVDGKESTGAPSLETEMEETCAVPRVNLALRKNATVTRNFENDMEETCGAFQAGKGFALTTNVNQATMPLETEMEETCAVPRANPALRKNATVTRNFETDMEETCGAFQAGKGFALTTNVNQATMPLETEMEETCAVPRANPALRKNATVTRNFETDMEETCGAFQAGKGFALTTNVNQATMPLETEMEETCAVPRANPALRKNATVTQNFDADMEGTCTVSQADKGFALTTNVNQAIIPLEAEMEETCALNQALLKNASVAKNFDADMEGTCTVSQADKGFAFTTNVNQATMSLETEMEETCAMPKAAALQRSVYTTNANTANNSQCFNAEMEVTCAVPRVQVTSCQKTSAFNETFSCEQVEAEMEETCAIPRMPKNNIDPSPNETEIENDYPKLLSQEISINAVLDNRSKCSEAGKEESGTKIDQTPHQSFRAESEAEANSPTPKVFVTTETNLNSMQAKVSVPHGTCSNVQQLGENSDQEVKTKASDSFQSRRTLSTQDENELSFLDKMSTTQDSNGSVFLPSSQDLSQKINKNCRRDPLDERSKTLSSEINNLKNKLKRFMDDLDSPTELGPSPSKQAKVATTKSVFEMAEESNPKRTDFGHWSLESSSETNATYSFFQGGIHLNLQLGHPIQNSPPHFAIRKATIRHMRSKNVCNTIKLADYLFLKSWNANRLIELFPSTENLCQSLATFGLSVNNAFELVMDLNRIAAQHIHFKCDDSYQVSMEFFGGVPRLVAFDIKVDFAKGFKAAKSDGVTLIPHKGLTQMISQASFDKIVAAAPSGWKFLSSLVEMLDNYILEAEKCGKSSS